MSTHECSQLCICSNDVWNINGLSLYCKLAGYRILLKRNLLDLDSQNGSQSVDRGLNVSKYDQNQKGDFYTNKNIPVKYNIIIIIQGFLLLTSLWN